MSRRWRFDFTLAKLTVPAIPQDGEPTVPRHLRLFSRGMVSRDGWVPADDLEWSAWEGVELGDLRPLAALLRTGRQLPVVIRDELICSIDRGLFDAAPARQAHIDKKDRRHFDRRERDWAIGAWVAVRDNATKRGTMGRIEEAAADRFNVSEGTVHRCYLAFKKEARDPEFGSYMAIFYWRAAREMCAEHGLDYQAFHEASYQVKKYDLDF